MKIREIAQTHVPDLDIHRVGVSIMRHYEGRLLLRPANEVRGKVIFSQVSIILSMGVGWLPQHASQVT